MTASGLVLRRAYPNHEAGQSHGARGIANPKLLRNPKFRTLFKGALLLMSRRPRGPWDERASRLLIRLQGSSLMSNAPLFCASREECQLISRLSLALLSRARLALFVLWRASDKGHSPLSLALVRLEAHASGTAPSTFHPRSRRMPLIFSCSCGEMACPFAGTCEGRWR